MPVDDSSKPGGLHITSDERLSLYAAARRLRKELKQKFGLSLELCSYFQDPFVAEEDPAKGLDRGVFVDWEPNLADGPTSARFAVVDYNADEQKLALPAKWDKKLQTFVHAETPLDGRDTNLLQFHQASVWALLQQTLAFFEAPDALGRRIPWGFDGNRLIVVPHAGYGKNAYYDRKSKSLQFYYFERDGKTIQTCLSSDIVRHEFGHAVLDGIRPLLHESSCPQTAAFHEFFGDLTAILTTLENDVLRRALAEATQGKMENAETVASIAEEFGAAVSDRPYLRSANDPATMSDVAGVVEPHKVSVVLTAAMFDLLVLIGNSYQEEPESDDDADDAAPKPKAATPKQAFYWAAERMKRMALHALDLLPPVDVTFRDYALAVCRAQRLADPLDPRKYYDMALGVFEKRGILTKADVEKLSKPAYLHDRLELKVQHNIDSISRSRATAYRFLDDNRKELLIPSNCDFVVADLYDSKKELRQRLPMPRQIILEYVWREVIPLTEGQFGRFKGRNTTMLCGGTLVFDDVGNVLSWTVKPGSAVYSWVPETGKNATSRAWIAKVIDGSTRRAEMLQTLENQITAGAAGSVIGTAKGILASQVTPVSTEEDGDLVHFHMSPHLNLSGDDVEDLGGRQWEMSC